MYSCEKCYINKDLRELDVGTEDDAAYLSKSLMVVYLRGKKVCKINS